MTGFTGAARLPDPPSSYTVTQTHPTRLPVVVTPAELPPLDPRVRLLVVGIRAALLLLCDALGEFAGLPKRG